MTDFVASDIVFGRDNVLGNLMLSASTGSVLGAFNAGPAPALANDVAFILGGSTLRAIADAVRGFKMPVRWAALAVRWRLRWFRG